MDKRSVAVIVGRPNVGKSLLFNRLCQRRAAIVHDAPGMTLDYLSEMVTLAADNHVMLIDTGGVQGEESAWSPQIVERMECAVNLADLLLVVVDAKAGLQHGDRELLSLLRRRWSKIPRLLVINKSEGMVAASACADFYAFKEDMRLVSAKRGDGLTALRAQMATMLPSAEIPQIAAPLAIIGRPNVGKSTLMNGLLKEDRALVSPYYGTTRDNVRAIISAPLYGEFALIDTAGMRRRRADDDRSRLSVAAAREAIKQAKVVLMMWDMSAGVQHQDKRLATMVAQAGCGVVLVGNKMDLIPAAERKRKFKRQTQTLPLGFAADSFCISASGGRLPSKSILLAANKALLISEKKFSTTQLNRILSQVVRHNPPPISGGFRPKLRYAHQGGRSPLRLVIHGSGVKRIAEDYKRYLSSSIARHLSLVGAPLYIDFRSEENPYVS